MTPTQKLITALFAPDDLVNVRVIADGGGKASNSIVDRGMAADIAGRAMPGNFPCVGINPRHDVKNLSAVKNMAIDIDGAPLPKWAKKQADVICTRDPMHHHLYFCFTEGVTRDEYKTIATRLIAATPGADKAVSDPERVLRLPGFAYNKKGVSGEGYKIAFIRKKINRMPIAEKFAWLPDTEATPTGTPQPVAAPNAVAYLKNLYLKKEKLTHGEGRSRRLWFVGIDCHAWGVPLADALTLATEINATFTPPETAAVVAHQVKSAYKYAKADFGALATRAADATDVKKRAELKAFERAQKVRDTFSRWVYIHGAARFVDCETRRALTAREQIEDFISREIGEAVNLRDLLSRGAFETADIIDYDPANDAEIFERDGLRVFNSYYPARHELARDESLKKSAVDVFKEHVAFIATSEDEEKTLTDYFAFCVQNPGRKVDWTPLIISPFEGLGKSTFAALFEKFFGAHNCSTVTAKKLLSGWTDFIAEKLFVVSHEVETHEDAALSELKSLITETRVTVNAKYAREYETTNRANFLLLSNKINALRLDGNARRFFVIYNRSEPRETEYYDTLYDAIENGAGWIYDYLCKRNLKNFRPHGAAPKTEGLSLLAVASKPVLVSWLDDRKENNDGAFAAQIIELAALESDVNLNAPMSVSRFANSRLLAGYLGQHGWQHYEYSLNGQHKRGWFRGGKEEFQTELQKLREKVK
jgi:hypothetical protein